MANNHKERPIRLRPRRSKRNPNDDPRRFTGAFGSFLRLVQMTRRRRSGGLPSQSPYKPSHLFGQRVSVRVSYSANKNPGQWKAHGRYVARDTATQGGDPSRAGFDATRTDINIASVLDSWQRVVAGFAGYWNIKGAVPLCDAFLTYPLALLPLVQVPN